MYKKLLGSTAVLLIVLCMYAGLAYGEELQTGTITANSVNFRQSPSTSADVLDQMDKGTNVSVISAGDSWTKIKYKNVIGWVYNDYIKTNPMGAGTVSARVLNVRSGASLTSTIVSTLEKGDTAVVLLKSGDWYKVKTSDGITGWVFSDYLTLQGSSASRGNVDRGDGSSTSNDTSSDTSNSVEAQDNSDLGQQIVDYAGRFMDSPYVYGGESPSGFDCSGFTSYVFRHFGINLDRTAAEQSQEGTLVEKSGLKPGDLLFFATEGGGISHVGIYAGDGKFIHAESRREGVTVTSLSSSYYVRTYVKAKRVF